MTGAPYVELSVQAGDDPAICSGHKAGTPLPLCDHQHRYIGYKDSHLPQSSVNDVHELPGRPLLQVINQNHT